MTLDALTTILLLALVVEFATEIIKAFLKSKRAGQSFGHLAGHDSLCQHPDRFAAGFGLETFYPLIDYLVTGLIISRGSNIIHEPLQPLKCREGKNGLNGCPCPAPVIQIPHPL
jgi:hypothetical protein